MTVSIPFQQQYTFRKLGYLYFDNSLSYRQVIEENSQFAVTELPPIGAEIRISGSQGSSSSLLQGDFIFGLPAGDQLDRIYPYSTELEYTRALNRYSLQSVVLRDQLNGVNLDSEPALTGVQSFG